VAVMKVMGMFTFMNSLTEPMHSRKSNAVKMVCASSKITEQISEQLEVNHLYGQPSVSLCHAQRCG
jgi:hypothetical protein